MGFNTKFLMPNYKYHSALLIDDNYIDNMINQKILKNAFFAQKIVGCPSCEEAMLYLKTEIEALKPLPEVIFLDIRMPEKSGFDFLDEFSNLNSDTNKIKVIVLSASLDPTDHKKVAENTNVVCFAYKPLSKELLNSI